MKSLLDVLGSKPFLKERLDFLNKNKEKQRGNSFIWPKPSKMSEKSEKKGLGLVFGYETFAMELRGRARG